MVYSLTKPLQSRQLWHVTFSPSAPSRRRKHFQCLYAGGYTLIGDLHQLHTNRGLLKLLDGYTVLPVCQTIVVEIWWIKSNSLFS